VFSSLNRGTLAAIRPQENAARTSGPRARKDDTWYNITLYAKYTVFLLSSMLFVIKTKKMEKKDEI